MSSLPFPMWFRWKHVGDITCNGETYSKFLCGPCRFLLVHWLNSWFLLVHSSCSNMLFKIAKRQFKGRREKVKFVCVSRVCFTEISRDLVPFKYITVYPLVGSVQCYTVAGCYGYGRGRGNGRGRWQPKIYPPKSYNTITRWWTFAVHQLHIFMILLRWDITSF